MQFNSAIGPYKGGMRFHPSVNLSILKFLGFEQTFKNALTTLPMGGGKGGSDFDPKGKSQGEIMRFCQALMTELYRHLGPDTDVPAGDIGVGGREVGFYGRHDEETVQQHRLRIYRQRALLRRQPDPPRGDRLRPGVLLPTPCCSATAWALRACGWRCPAPATWRSTPSKALELDARVITVSDSGGTPGGRRRLHYREAGAPGGDQNQRYGRVADYARERGLTYLAGQQPWNVPVDIALPCATQNELDLEAAQTLIQRGEGGSGRRQHADHHPGHRRLPRRRVLFAPGKAANAGGVATSGLEMAQNAARIGWRAEKWMYVYNISWRIFTMPAWNTAARASKPTMYTARISPVSSDRGRHAGAGRAVIRRKGDLVHTSIKCFNAGLCAGIILCLHAIRMMQPS